MVIVQSRPKRKASGGRYITLRGKRKFERGNRPTNTKLGQTKSKFVRTRGGHTKFKLLEANTVNLFNPKSKKFSKATIKNVLENPANRHYVRRNILTKGTIIETEVGKAKITSRPGQEKVINAVLV